MDVSCMSLDDIINEKKQKKKQKARRDFGQPAVATVSTGQRVSGSGAKDLAPNPKQIRDARDIICMKARKKIVDARDKLNEKLRDFDASERRRQREREAMAPGVEHLDADNRAINRQLRTPPINRAARPSSPPPINRAARSSSPPPVNRAARAKEPYYNRPVTCYNDIEDTIDHSDSSPERSYKRKVPTQRVSPSEPLKRIVKNDVYSLPTTMPPPPEFCTIRKVTKVPLMPSSSLVDLPWSDPFQVYELSRRQHMSAPPAPFPVAAHVPYKPTSSKARHPRSILRNRSRSPTLPMGDATGNPQLSSSMRARLERAPNPSKSMGIFSKLPDTYSREYIPSSYVKVAPLKTLPSAPSSVVYRGPSAAPPSPPTTGYRIVVSNLHSNVIDLDIEELFSDIGELIETRLVRPGVAEVIYRKLEDAEKAVDAYHNRQLDGQPMNCLLVHPRASNKPTAPALSSVKFSSR